MKKTLVAILISIAAVIIALLVISDMSGQPPLKDAPIPASTPALVTWAGYESKKVTIEGQEYNLLVADTIERQAQGLMNVTELGEYDGMMFPSESSSIKTFWNQNTLMDLDLYWMKDGQVVGKSLLPSITRAGEIVRVSSPEPVNMVIELPRKK